MMSYLCRNTEDYKRFTQHIWPIKEPQVQAVIDSSLTEMIWWSTMATDMFKWYGKHYQVLVDSYSGLYEIYYLSDTSIAEITKPKIHCSKKCPSHQGYWYKQLLIEVVIMQIPKGYDHLGLVKHVSRAHLAWWEEIQKKSPSHPSCCRAKFNTMTFRMTVNL